MCVWGWGGGEQSWWSFGWVLVLVHSYVCSGEFASVVVESWSTKCESSSGVDHLCV